MKLRNLFIVTILLTFVFISSCKTEKAKDLIVRKWKFTEVSGPDAAIIADSIKTKILETATMEFKKDGTYEQSGGAGMDGEKGTYTVSDDGKTVISTSNSSGVGDTVMILELSKTKLVVSPKPRPGQNLKFTMMPK